MFDESSASRERRQYLAANYHGSGKAVSQGVRSINFTHRHEVIENDAEGHKIEHRLQRFTDEQCRPVSGGSILFDGTDANQLLPGRLTSAQGNAPPRNVTRESGHEL